MEKCTECPECGSPDYIHPDYLAFGYRVCAKCEQEWYTTINYKKYSSPSYYYEVFTSFGRSLPPKDKNGDSIPFDKRSVKRRIKGLIKNGWPVNAMVTKKNKRELIFSSFENTKIDLIGISARKGVSNDR